MARPKKDKPAPAGTESKQTTPVKEPTPIKVVKSKAPKEEEWPLRKKDQFLFIKDGKKVYYTRSAANVLFIRNAHDIEIPKGSDYVPPQGSKCKGCE